MKKIKRKKVEPLTDVELENLTGDELAYMDLYEDEVRRLRAIFQARDEERKQRVARIQAEMARLADELRNLGLNIRTVGELIKHPGPYEQAIPILLRHLRMPYSDAAKETIARVLAVPEPEVRRAWPMLVEEYRKAPMGRGIIAPGDTKEIRFGAKDGLACTLSVAVTDETLPEFIALIKDPANGESRVLMLDVLRKSKHPLAKQTLEELANDPVFEKEISSWRRKPRKKKQVE